MYSIDFLVGVRCFTFNHAPYIEDAMNGFCMQRTNFPYICVIVDDDSSDKEKEVISKYLYNNFDLKNKGVVRNEETDDYLMKFAQHKKNVNCYFAVYFLKYNHFKIKKSKFPYFADFFENVKYYAFCEGDDYWSDPLKMQEQIDILENNPQFSVCTHAFFKLIDGQLVKPSDILDKNFEYSLEDSLKRWITQPLTAVYRKSAYPSSDVVEQYSKFQDNHFFYYLLKRDKGYNIGRYMGVYRITGTGICTSLGKLDLLKDDIDCYQELLFHNMDDYILRNHLLNHYSTYLLYSLFKLRKPYFIPTSLIGVTGYFRCFIMIGKKIVKQPLKYLKQYKKHGS